MNIKFMDLFDISEIQKLQDRFSDASGIASIITDPKGNPITRPSRFCSFCRRIRSNKIGNEKCRLSDSVIASKSLKGPAVYKCLSAGLYAAGAPIYASEKHIANWLIGQIRDDTIKHEQIIRYAGDIGEDPDIMLQEFDEIPVIDLKSFNKQAYLLYDFSKKISVAALTEKLKDKNRFSDSILEIFDNELEKGLRLFARCQPFDNKQRKKGNAVFNSPDKISENDMDLFKPGTGNVCKNLLVRESIDDVIKGKNLFRQIYQNISAGIALVSLDFRIIRANNSYCSMLGYSEDELIGAHLRDITHPEILEENLRLQKSLAKGEIDYFRLEKSFIHKNGKTVYGLLDANLIRDKKGIPSYFIGTVMDITERKKAEEEKEILLSAIEQASDAVIITNRIGEIQYVNSSCEKISGWSKQEMTGSNFFKPVYSIEDMETFREMIKTVKGKKLWKGRMQNIRKDGSCYTEDTVVTPVTDSSGKVKNYIVLRRDVSDQINLEKQIRRSEKMEAIGYLAGGIAHDFNNILSAVIGYADLSLGIDDDTGKIHQNLEKIISAGERAKALINRILSFSRYKVEVKKSVYLEPVVREVVELLKATFPSSVDIETDISEGRFCVNADPDRIHEVIMNLATNSLHAVGEKGVVSISLKEEKIETGFQCINKECIPGQYSVITVEDNGKGIPEKELIYIFDPFYTTKDVGEGTGMGLAVVYGIIEDHNGCIYVESSPSKGSLFRIYLPELYDEVSNVSDERAVVKNKGSERILFVDDEELISRMMKEMLEKMGYRVDSFTDSRTAYEIFRNESGKYDIVITDQTMPEMTGYELGMKIMEIRKDIPVILCTGYSSTVDEEKALSSGFKGFLFKPLRKNDIADKIREILDKDI